MREIVLDTETTGFDPEAGDRIVEIGAVELMHHLPTGRTYHQYLNPERSMPPGAFEVHGLGPDILETPRKPASGEISLADKPVFAEIGQAFLDFVGDAKLVIHNAAFDIKFLNAELGWMDQTPIMWERAIDTLAMARSKFPGAPASLDALCRRFGIDNSERTLHGALLDSEILAEVYLELIGGRQPGFGLEVATAGEGDGTGQAWRPAPRSHPLPPRLTDAERAAHDAFIATLGEGAVWLKSG